MSKGTGEGETLDETHEYPFNTELWNIVDSTGYPSVEVDYVKLCEFIDNLMTVNRHESHILEATHRLTDASNRLFILDRNSYYKWLDEQKSSLTNKDSHE